MALGESGSLSRPQPKGNGVNSGKHGVGTELDGLGGSVFLSGGELSLRLSERLVTWCLSCNPLSVSQSLVNLLPVHSSCLHPTPIACRCSAQVDAAILEIQQTEQQGLLQVAELGSKQRGTEILLRQSLRQRIASGPFLCRACRACLISSPIHVGTQSSPPNCRMGAECCSF